MIASACTSDSGTSPDPSPRADALVCGLIDRDVVTEHLTGDLEFRPIGDLGTGQEDAPGARCQLVEGMTTYLTARVYKIEDDDRITQLRGKIEREGARLQDGEDCRDFRAIDDDLGVGNVCATRQGEVDLALVSGQRVIRLTAKSGLDEQTPVEAALAIARSIVSNTSG